ncbi:hypothetical protein HHK36_010566 [Tetracentron sinense]|uniref:Protein kinase domain-containing protein n=1 Tax=Tetracentron sinense TaxID=13715 RepID=A0A835DGK1_TETSI|nr:hypothetical protein HHK36_010566 [Tetracentron sinense]
MLDRYVLSSKIQSALGYMAPEFACRTVKITEKCDVYGFGVLVLEVVTGKRPVAYMEDDVVVLCDMMRGALEEGKVPSNRPDMGEVVNILELIRCPSEGQEELDELTTNVQIEEEGIEIMGFSANEESGLCSIMRERVSSL